MISLIRPTIDEQDVSQFKSAAESNPKENGATVKEFEKEFAKYIGKGECIATSSGTTALYVLLRALGVNKGDEVILPSYTCVTLANAVLHLGASPVLVDNSFQPESMNFNADFEDVVNSITRRTKAIVVPSMFGTPVDVTQLRKVGLPVIEDGAQALGAELDGRKVGSVSGLSIFSFNSKMITTGKGGMVLCNNRNLLSFIRSITSFDDQIVALRNEVNLRKIRMNFDLGFEMSDFQAAVGLGQLKKIRYFIAKRRKIANQYAESFFKLDIAAPDPRKTKGNVFFRFMVRTEKKVGQILAAARQMQIEYGRGVYPPIHYYYRKSKRSFANVEKAINSMISVPIYPSLSQKEIDRIIAVSTKLL